MIPYFFILYILILILICGWILFYSETPSKALAYLLLVSLFPIVGIIFYLSVGINYRKRKLYQKKLAVDENAYPEFEQRVDAYSKEVLKRKKNTVGHFSLLANYSNYKSLTTDKNKAKLLFNGEEKFPEVIESLKQAKHHIHIEYYIYENDVIGNLIADILIEKAQAGVEVRFIYDDFGSQNIRKNLVPKLRKAGVEAYPFYKITLIHFANRMNYRNHRKIIVVDGIIGYVGGINVSDKYINPNRFDLFWRDTHLKLEGPSVLNLQYVFLTDWNYCAVQQIPFSIKYFPLTEYENSTSDQIVQLVSSGPDSDFPNIMYALLQAILLAKEKVHITTPYFIPEKSFMSAIKIAALRGVDVKILVPGISDSVIVNNTSHSYFQEILEVGVKIYTYQKGFVHAKTMVCDEQLAIVGTANLDNRSFDLNFEINAFVYDEQTAKELTKAFEGDLKHSTQLLLDDWINRPFYIRFFEKIMHLLSPLM